jgi:hypothetical protein
MRLGRPSHATIVAYLALGVALGGTSYAAVTVTGRQVKDSSLTGRDVRNGSLTGNDIKRRSVPLNRLSGTLPAGPAGPAGPTGARGPSGEPDYSKVYDKPAADARFLAKTGKATDADALDGLDGSAYAKGAVTTISSSRSVPQMSSETLLTLPGWGKVSVLNCTASFANVSLVRDGGDPSSLWTSNSVTPAGGSAGTNWASAGSYSAPSGWVRYTIAKAGSSVQIEAHGRWDGVGCTFVVVASTFVD